MSEIAVKLETTMSIQSRGLLGDGQRPINSLQTDDSDGMNQNGLAALFLKDRSATTLVINLRVNSLR